MSKKSKIQINYKSGISMVFECDNFVTRRLGGELSSVEAAGAHPIPMFFGIDDIESVWEL